MFSVCGDRRTALRVSIIAILFTQAAFYGQMRGRRGNSAAPAHPEAYKGIVITFHGALKKLTKKEIIIESSENHELLTFRRNKATKFLNGTTEIKPTDVDMETQVSIDASEDVDLKLMAISLDIAPPPSTGQKPTGK